MSEPHGGLRLPSVVAGIGESEARQVDQEWSSYDQVKRYLEENLALTIPIEPSFSCPTLKVGDLTTTDNTAYTETYVQRVAWFGFYSERKAEHDAIVLELEEKMGIIETRIRNQLRKLSKKVTASGEPKPPPAQEMEDTINSDSHYLDLKHQLIFHRQVLKRLNARVETLDREIRLTSRQVEIRRQDFDNAMRGNSSVRTPAPGMRTPRSYGRE